jgi:hypothetical protein
MISDDWSSFQALDDDDEDFMIDTNVYAEENDSQEAKAAVGATVEDPTIERPAEPILVPPGRRISLRAEIDSFCFLFNRQSHQFDYFLHHSGSMLELSEETVLGVLAACREELGTLFGYTAENRGVGITGGVDYVDMEGPTVVLSLKGRFWHQRSTVLERVANYLQQRIPEIVDVAVEDQWQLTDEANDVW